MRQRVLFASIPDNENLLNPASEQTTSMASTDSTDSPMYSCIPFHMMDDMKFIITNHDLRPYGASSDEVVMKMSFSGYMGKSSELEVCGADWAIIPRTHIRFFLNKQFRICANSTEEQDMKCIPITIEFLENSVSLVEQLSSATCLNTHNIHDRIVNVVRLSDVESVVTHLNNLPGDITSEYLDELCVACATVPEAVDTMFDYLNDAHPKDVVIWMLANDIELNLNNDCIDEFVDIDDFKLKDFLGYTDDKDYLGKLSTKIKSCNNNKKALDQIFKTVCDTLESDVVSSWIEGK